MSGNVQITEKPIVLSLKDRAMVSRQMSALIDAGLSVTKALGVITKQTKQPRLRTELQQVLAELEEGIGLSQTFRRWDSFMVSLLKAAEAGGELSDVLNRLARFYEERLRLQTKVITTLMYPVVIFIISFVVFLGMVTFILPQFSQVYARLGGELPAYTRFWMELSHFLRSPWGIGGFVVLLLCGYGFIQKRAEYIPALEKALVAVPVLGEVIVQFSATRFARTLGTLMRCGVPLSRALAIARVPLFPIAQIQNEVSEGVRLNQAMCKYPRLFPEMLVSMVAVGEETGELNQLLLKAADYYDQELEGLLSRLTALIEPMIIVLLGGLIGSVVIGMYLPMFQLFNQIQ